MCHNHCRTQVEAKKIAKGLCMHNLENCDGSIMNKYYRTLVNSDFENSSMFQPITWKLALMHSSQTTNQLLTQCLKTVLIANQYVERHNELLTAAPTAAEGCELDHS